MKILTFDIEDWWGYDYYKLGDRSDWEPRLDKYLRVVLDLLDGRGIKATFFILGEVAVSNPAVVKGIAERVHHIGCHSFSHTFWKQPTEKEIKEDTYKALNAIEDCIGQKVTAYRAPAFSITRENCWILSVLAEAGILYDCSIFPTSRSFGGFPEYKSKFPSKIEIDGVSIKEFPIAPSTIWGREIVYSGGGYFRIFPYFKIKALTVDSDYVMTYFHIRDFDKEQARTFATLEGESVLTRYFKNYIGLNSCFKKFTRYVSDFDFCSVKEADAEINWEELPAIRL